MTLNTSISIEYLGFLNFGGNRIANLNPGVVAYPLFMRRKWIAPKGAGDRLILCSDDERVKVPNAR